LVTSRHQINHDPPSWSKIASFLLSPDWEAQFPYDTRRRLPRVLSDDFPLLLDCGDVVKGKGYFKFVNMSLNSKVFVKKMNQWSSSYSFQGSPSFFFACKLKTLKLDFKKMEC
jgi:hypothetical protein